MGRPKKGEIKSHKINCAGCGAKVKRSSYAIVKAYTNNTRLYCTSECAHIHKEAQHMADYFGEKIKPHVLAKRFGLSKSCVVKRVKAGKKDADLVKPSRARGLCLRGKEYYEQIWNKEKKACDWKPPEEEQNLTLPMGKT